MLHSMYLPSIDRSNEYPFILCLFEISFLFVYYGYRDNFLNIISLYKVPYISLMCIMIALSYDVFVCIDVFDTCVYGYLYVDLCIVCKYVPVCQCVPLSHFVTYIYEVSDYVTVIPQ